MRRQSRRRSEIVAAVELSGGGYAMTFETLNLRQKGPVVFASIAAPPMNLLGPNLVRDLVSFIQGAEADHEAQVVVFHSADPDFSSDRST